MKKLFLFFYLFVMAFLLGNAKLEMNRKVTRIYLDAGHGGLDGGCSFENIIEKDLNLQMVIILGELFESIGFEVSYTRTTDNDLSTPGTQTRKREDIHERVRLINESNVDLYLSLHMNTYPIEKYSGAQVFYASNHENNALLAKCIQDSLKESTTTTRLQKQIKGVYLLEHTEKPGVLIECGFLSNSEERERLITRNYQEIVSNAIFFGVLQYLNMV